jgi:hypothetical protein
VTGRNENQADEQDQGDMGLLKAQQKDAAVPYADYRSPFHPACGGVPDHL